MTLYCHVAGPAITPTCGGPVALGDTVDLDELAARPYVEAGVLAAAAVQPAPAADPAAKRARRRKPTA